MRQVHYFAIQPDQPKCRLIEKISNFHNFVIFNQGSMKLGTLVVYELLNPTISIFFGPTNQKSVLQRFFQKNLENKITFERIEIVYFVCTLDTFFSATIGATELVKVAFCRGKLALKHIQARTFLEKNFGAAADAFYAMCVRMTFFAVFQQKWNLIRIFLSFLRCF